jgi:hypothetical protein
MPTFSLCWCGSLAIVGFVGMVDIFGSIFIPIGALDERAPAGPFCFKPRWLLGRRDLGPPHRPLPRPGTRGGGIEKTPLLAPFSEAHKLWRCSRVDRAFSRQ